MFEQYLYRLSDIYFEGKKEVIQKFSKLYSDHSESDLKNIVNTLEKLDPTSPKNKYLSLITNAFIGEFPDKEKLKRNVDMFKDRFYILQFDDHLRDIENRNLKVDTQTKVKNLGELGDLLNDTRNVKTKSSYKKGIDGVTKNKDYLEIGSTELANAYIPLNYEASKIIASKNVGNCEGKWCTSYQKSQSHWDTYTENGILTYIVNPTAKESRFQKIAIHILKGDYDADDDDPFEMSPSPITISYFDAKDNKMTTAEVMKESGVWDLIRKSSSYMQTNWGKIRKKIEEEVQSNKPRVLYWMINSGAPENSNQIMRLIFDFLKDDTIKFGTRKHSLAFRDEKQFKSSSVGSHIFTFGIKFKTDVLERHVKREIGGYKTTSDDADSFITFKTKSGSYDIYKIDKVSSVAEEVLINKRYKKWFMTALEDRDHEDVVNRLKISFI